MTRFFGLAPVVMAALIGGLVWWSQPASATQGPNFDKLSAQDRAAFQKRFEVEIWPLLVRSGKDGCIGCHAGKIVSALHTKGDVAKDFPMLLKDGFFLVDDPGNLLSRIKDANAKRRMPPGGRPRWTDEEAATLRAFMVDMDRKQEK